MSHLSRTAIAITRDKVSRIAQAKVDRPPVGDRGRRQREIVACGGEDLWVLGVARLNMNPPTSVATKFVFGELLARTSVA